MMHSFLHIACYVLRVVLTTTRSSRFMPHVSRAWPPVSSFSSLLFPLPSPILRLTPYASRFWFLASDFSFSAFRLPSSLSRPLHFCLLLISLLIPPASVFAVTTQEVEEALTCQCGCGLTVHSCNHLQCGFAVPAKRTILDLVSQGQTKEEIAASFMARYGEKVLSAPTTSGFNLAAWLTPFLAIAVGGVLIGFISFRWTRQRRQQESDAQRTAMAPDQYRECLKKELESFEG
jgi:cytochrome c-type biogenesis protein CcmH